ncbi:MAG: aminotransferase class IV [Myxococcota bacterium]|nr:aminotransferase class IV [Myxococcota bacterium]
MERVLRVRGAEQPVIAADDPGLMLGLTVFDTLRCYDGVPFRLDAHLDRLEASAVAMGIALVDRGRVREEILSVCRDDWRVRYMVTAGGAHVVDAAPLDPARVGAPLKAARIAWSPAPGLAGSVKHGSRAGWILTAQKLGVDEVLLVDEESVLLEANRSSVFGVIGGEVYTPALDGRMLDGVTRSALLEAGAEAGIVCHETQLDAYAEYEELYLASTLKELAPVTELDGVAGPGAGPVGARLHAAFRALVARETARV